MYLYLYIHRTSRNTIFAVTCEARVIRENIESRESEGGEGGV